MAYLDTAAEGLPPDDAQEALGDYYRDKASGTPGRRRFYAELEECVGAAAKLLRVDSRDVALLSNASEGLNVLANSIDWRAGDEVLLSDLEFPSNVLAWLRLRERGVRVRVIPSEGGVVTRERFAESIGPATRLVAVSQVSYRTGANLSYVPALAQEAHRAGAVVCVDATQALGRVPVSVDGIDYLVASSYKWMLGTHGLGVVYLSPELRERITPGTLGWYSVQNIFTSDRFERYEYKPGAARLVAGMPNFPAVYVLRRSLELLLDAGIERLHCALAPLVSEVRAGIVRLGLDPLTPPQPEYGSGIVSFAHPRCERLGALLEEAGVVLWRGDGRLRASLHLYNDAGDVDRLLGSLKEALAKTEAPHE